MANSVGELDGIKRQNERGVWTSKDADNFHWILSKYTFFDSNEALQLDHRYLDKEDIQRVNKIEQKNKENENTPNYVKITDEDIIRHLEACNETNTNKDCGRLFQALRELQQAAGGKHSLSQINNKHINTRSRSSFPFKSLNEFGYLTKNHSQRGGANKKNSGYESDDDLASFCLSDGTSLHTSSPTVKRSNCNKKHLSHIKALKKYSYHRQLFKTQHPQATDSQYTYTEEYSNIELGEGSSEHERWIVAMIRRHGEVMVRYMDRCALRLANSYIDEYNSRPNVFNPMQREQHDNNHSYMHQILGCMLEELTSLPKKSGSKSATTSAPRTTKSASSSKRSSAIFFGHEGTIAERIRPKKDKGKSVMFQVNERLQNSYQANTTFALGYQSPNPLIDPAFSDWLVNGPVVSAGSVRQREDHDDGSESHYSQGAGFKRTKSLLDVIPSPINNATPISNLTNRVIDTTERPAALYTFNHPDFISVPNSAIIPDDNFSFANELAKGQSEEDCVQNFFNIDEAVQGSLSGSNATSHYPSVENSASPDLLSSIHKMSVESNSIPTGTSTTGKEIPDGNNILFSPPPSNDLNSICASIFSPELNTNHNSNALPIKGGTGVLNSGDSTVQNYNNIEGVHSNLNTLLGTSASMPFPFQLHGRWQNMASLETLISYAASAPNQFAGPNSNNLTSSIPAQDDITNELLSQLLRKNGNCNSLDE